MAAAATGVLIVNDQPELRALLQTILRHHGFRVFLARDGSDAVEVCRHHGDDILLVLIDAAESRETAHRTLQELQSVHPKVIACFLVGEKDTHSDLDLITLGAARVIHKPFEPSELARTLWALVSIRDRRASKRRACHSTRIKVGAGMEPDHVVESWIADQADNGIQLRLPKKLGDVGALLSIRAADADDDTPWIPVQIRHMHEDGGLWVAGCQFLLPAAKELGE
jgi:two-component system OmpR family response regulator